MRCCYPRESSISIRHDNNDNNNNNNNNNKNKNNKNNNNNNDKWEQRKQQQQQEIKNTDIQSLQEKSHFPQNEEHKLENTFFVFVLEISERSSRWSTSSTFRHQGVKHEDKGKDKDTAAPCTLLMLFECWVSLKHPLALYLWYSPWLSFTVVTFYWGEASWRNEKQWISWHQASTRGILWRDAALPSPSFSSSSW